MRACRHIEVDRAGGERSLAVARDFLDRGEVVGIFPEATISRAMEIKDLKTGAARIAAAAGVPLLPARAVGHPALDDQGPRQGLLPRQGHHGLGRRTRPADRRSGRGHRRAEDRDERLARRCDPELPPARAGGLVAARVVRRQRADAGGRRPPRRRGAGGPGRAQGDPIRASGGRRPPGVHAQPRCASARRCVARGRLSSRARRQPARPCASRAQLLAAGAPAPPATATRWEQVAVQQLLAHVSVMTHHRLLDTSQDVTVVSSSLQPPMRLHWCR